MLLENKSISEQGRRWFGDDYFDLIVWYDEDGRMTGFRLCYEIHANERALSWMERTGLTHHRIDSGDSSPQMNMAPILLPDDIVPYEEIARQFNDRAGNIEQDIFNLVIRKLSEGRRAERGS